MESHKISFPIGYIMKEATAQCGDILSMFNSMAFVIMQFLALLVVFASIPIYIPYIVVTNEFLFAY